MKKILVCLVVLGLYSAGSFADDKITVKIGSVANVKGNGAIEACGTAVHSEGKWPLLVTIEHGGSFYSTIANKDGKWCQVVKRWTFSGNVAVTAIPISGN